MDQVTAAALAVALVVNLVVLSVAIVWTRRHPGEAEYSQSRPRASAVAASRQASDGRTPEPAVTRDAADVPVVVTSLPDPVARHPRAAEELAALEPIDAWRPMLALEAGRVVRYRHPATVVLADLEGVDRLSTRLGAGAVERLLPAVAGTLRREARAADRIVRLGNARFGVLLPETDEIAAINWVERVRDAANLWLEASAVSLRLSFGWAELGPDGDLEATLARARERLDHERRAENGRADGPTASPPHSSANRGRASAFPTSSGSSLAAG